MAICKIVSKLYCTFLIELFQSFDPQIALELLSSHGEKKTGRTYRKYAFKSSQKSSSGRIQITGKGVTKLLTAIGQRWVLTWRGWRRQVITRFGRDVRDIPTLKQGNSSDNKRAVQCSAMKLMMMPRVWRWWDALRWCHLGWWSGRRMFGEMQKLLLLFLKASRCCCWWSAKSLLAVVCSWNRCAILRLS